MDRRGHCERGCKWGISARCEQQLVLDLKVDLRLETSDLPVILGVDISEDRVMTLWESVSISWIIHLYCLDALVVGNSLEESA